MITYMYRACEICAVCGSVFRDGVCPNEKCPKLGVAFSAETVMNIRLPEDDEFSEWKPLT